MLVSSLPVSVKLDATGRHWMDRFVNGNHFVLVTKNATLENLKSVYISNFFRFSSLFVEQHSWLWCYVVDKPVLGVHRSSRQMCNEQLLFPVTNALNLLF